MHAEKFIIRNLGDPKHYPGEVDVIEAVLAKVALSLGSRTNS